MNSPQSFSRRPAMHGGETVKRKTVRPLRWLSWTLALVAIGVILLVNMLGGFFLLLIAALVDRPRYECGDCRNPVAEKSKMCPTCGVGLKGYE